LLKNAEHAAGTGGSGLDFLVQEQRTENAEASEGKGDEATEEDKESENPEEKQPAIMIGIKNLFAEQLTQITTLFDSASKKELPREEGCQECDARDSEILRLKK